MPGCARYVDAGYGLALIVRKTGVVERLSSEGLPLGVMPDEDWVSNDVMLEDGDTLVIASDGVLDLIGDGSDVRSALEFVAQYPDPVELCSRARALAEAAAALDDVTLVASRRHPTSEALAGRPRWFTCGRASRGIVSQCGRPSN